MNAMELIETLNKYNTPVSCLITKQEYDCLETLIDTINDVVVRLEKYDYGYYERMAGEHLNWLCQTGRSIQEHRESLDTEYQKIQSMKRSLIKKLLNAETEFTNSYNRISHDINSIDIRPNIMVNINQYRLMSDTHKTIVDLVNQINKWFDEKFPMNW